MDDVIESSEVRSPEEKGEETPASSSNVADRETTAERSLEEKREKVINALNTAISIMELAKEKRKLSREEELDLQDILTAKAQTLDTGKETFSPGKVVSRVSGISYKFRDRIPTDRLMSFLGKEIDAEIAVDPESERAKEYAQILKILNDNSRSYIRKGRRMNGDRLTARVGLEAVRISSGERNTFDDANNYFLAQSAVNNRTELFIPRLPRIEKTASPPLHEYSSTSEPTTSETDTESAETIPAPSDAPEETADESEPPADVEEDNEGIPPQETIREARASWDVVVMGMQEYALKTAFNMTAQEIENREALDITAKNFLLRGLKLFRQRVLTRQGWKKTKFGLQREYFRHTNTRDLMRRLAEANMGTSNDLSGVAYEILQKGGAKISELRERESSGLRATSGEELPQVVEGELRSYVLNDVLRPAMHSINSGEDMNKIQADIQKKLYEFVNSHQSDSQIREFFGENASRYGQVSQFFANDILETAKMMINDARAHELATGALDDIIQVRLARAKWATSSEVPYTTVDRLVAAGQRHRSLSWLTPVTASVLAFAGTRGLQTIARRAAVIGAGTAAIATSPFSAPLIGIAVGASFAFAREHQRYKSDILKTSRDLETGKRSGDNMHLRKSIERFVAPLQVRIDQLINGDKEGDVGVNESRRRSINELISSNLDINSASTEEERNEITKNRADVVERIAEIQARLDAPNEVLRRRLPPVLGEIGRIQYEGSNIEQQRLVLTRKLIELRNKAKEVGISDEVLEQAVIRESKKLTTQRGEWEIRYRLESIKRALGYAGVASVTGVFSALFIQEAVALSARAPGIEDTGFGKYGRSPTVLEKGLGRAGVNIGPSAHPEDMLSTQATEPVPSTQNVEVDQFKQEVIDLDMGLDRLDRFDVDDVIESYRNGNSFSINNLVFNPEDQINPDGTRSYSILDAGTGDILYSKDLVTINGQGAIQIKGPLDVSMPISPQIKEILKNNSFQINESVINTTEPYEVLTPDTKLYEARMGIDGPKTLIPEGTVWIDGKDGAHTLIVADRPDIVLIPDAKLIEVNGKLTLEWDKNYTYPGYDSRMEGGRHEGLLSNIKIESGQAEIKANILGENGVWEKEATPVKHLWYTYNTPESDQSELMLYTHKDGNTLILDMSKMGVVYQDGLPTVNMQDVIREGRAVFAFSLPNDIDNPILVKDTADGKADGLLRLDPNAPDNMRIDPDNPNSMSLADFSKMIVNQEELAKYPDGDIATEVYHREAVFNLGKDGMRGCIEAGFIGESSDGIPRYMNVGLIRGSSDLPEVVGVPETTLKIQIGPLVENIPHNQTVVTITPPDLPEPAPPPPPTPPLPPTPPAPPPTPPLPPTPPAPPLTPPLAPEIGEPPLIPVDLVMRSPLEVLLAMYGYGYRGEGIHNEIGLIPWEDHIKRRSPRLIANPSAELNEETEVNSYLSNLPSEYRRELEVMNQALQPMHEACRAVIVIPAYYEGRIISSTLEHFLNQKDSDGNPLDPNLFEIIIFDNHPESTPKDNTESEVSNFIRLHPEMKVTYIHKAWGRGDIARVGNARKYGSDLALIRSQNRPTHAGKLILISNDADIDGVSDKYVASYIKAFDENNNLDAVAGKWTLPEVALQKPNIRAGQRMWYFLDRIISRDAEGDPSLRQFRAPGLIGRNSAYTASIYAAIGGYNPNAKLGEDLEIGWMINSARNWDNSRIGYISKPVELVSNPRRYLAAMVQGVPLYHMYYGFHENTQIRQLDNQQLLNMIPDTLDLNRFEEDINAFWLEGHHPDPSQGNYKWLGERFDKIFDRVMGLMGVEYQVIDNKVKITDASKLLMNVSAP